MPKSKKRKRDGRPVTRRPEEPLFVWNSQGDAAAVIHTLVCSTIQHQINQDVHYEQPDWDTKQIEATDGKKYWVQDFDVPMEQVRYQAEYVTVAEIRAKAKRYRSCMVCCPDVPPYVAPTWRQISVKSLAPRHVNHDVEGLGTLAEVRIKTDGWHLVGKDGHELLLDEDARVYVEIRR